MVTAYCVRCKASREMKDTTNTKTKKGVPMVKGICPTCGTKMCRIGGQK